MSGHGKFWPELYNAWSGVLKIEGTRTNEDNHLIESGEIYLDMYKKYFEFVGSKYWKNKGAIEDIAHTGQVLFEHRVIELIRNLHAKAPHTKKIALSGGIFANVKLNKRINELELFEEIFILPPMGDEGLALGCAVGVMSQIEPDFKPIKLNDVFLGTEYTRDEIFACSEGFKKDPFYLNVVVNLLLDKKIV